MVYDAQDDKMVLLSYANREGPDQTARAYAQSDQGLLWSLRY